MHAKNNWMSVILPGNHKYGGWYLNAHKRLVLIEEAGIDTRKHNTENNNWYLTPMYSISWQFQ